MSNSEKKDLLKDQAYRNILDQIVSGAIKDGKFPAEPEYCRELGISRVTLRSALARLEKEGLISRSHYYGTRVIGTSETKRRVLVTLGAPLNPAYWITNIVRELGVSLRKEQINIDYCDLSKLSHPADISKKYMGVFLFGASITGDEPFMKVLKVLTIPVVYLREEDNIVIRDVVSSVGINMKEAWTKGFDYLASLGLRRIGVIMSSDKRNLMRMGFIGTSFAAHLRKQGYTEAAKMVRVINDFSKLETVVKDLVLKSKVEALFCYSDELAQECWDIVLACGKSVPNDVALLGIGSYHTNPSLSSVERACSLSAAVAVQLLLKLAKNNSMKKFHLTLPYSLYLGQSTKKVNCEGLLKQAVYDKKRKEKGKKYETKHEIIIAN